VNSDICGAVARLARRCGRGSPWAGAALTALQSILAGDQRLRDRPGEDAARRREPGVARRQRHQVEVAHDRHRHELDGQAKILDQTPHQQELLVVLLTKDGEVGLHDRKEHGDDGEDAVEVAGAVGALEHATKRTRHNARVEAGRVHLVGRWRKHPIHAAASTQLEVGLEDARISVEVVGALELQRVHKDGAHNDVGAAAGLVEQGGVTVVQGAHRGHKPNRGPLGAGGEHPGLDLRGRRHRRRRRRPHHGRQKHE